MYWVFRPILFRMDAERAHDVALSLGRFVQSVNPRLVEPVFQFDDERLHQRIWGLHFDNPVGLAAGMDKNGRLLSLWHAVGFGHVEIGSVTANPSAGNQRPRAFRLPADYALINRMGLNNDGADEIARRLADIRPRLSIPLGINIAKTPDPAILEERAVQDFKYSFGRLSPYADYVTLNVSCPNTEDGKTFEDPEPLSQLLQEIMRERDLVRPDLPVLVKLSPPPTESFAADSRIDEVLNILKSYEVDGIVATNTASDRQGLISDPETVERIGRGGLSGAPIEARSTEVIRHVFRRTDGRIPIIGVGGVSSGVGAYMKIRAGASLLQLYTGLTYEGPGIVRQIKKDLVHFVKRDGFKNISQAVGLDA